MKSLKRSATWVLALAAAGLLAACGSGVRPIDRESAISLTGSADPVETAADQQSRAAAVAARTDAVVASTLYVEVEELALAPECSAAHCDLIDLPTGVFLTVTLDDLVDRDTPGRTARAVLTRHGVTLVERRGGTGTPRYRSYGAWTDHGSFSVSTGLRSEPGDGPLLTARGADASGDLTGSRAA